jgi:hypothetical protein
MTRQNVTNLGMRGYRFAVLRAGARGVYVTETETETEMCATEMRVRPTELRLPEAAPSFKSVA